MPPIQNGLIKHMNIYVGNLSYEVRDSQLQDLFTQFGSVSSAKVIMDRNSGRSKGFGFVEMEDEAAGQKAIDELNGTDFDGRKIVVNVARPKSDSGGGRPRF